MSSAQRISLSHRTSSHKLTKLTRILKSTVSRVLRDEHKLKDKWENVIFELIIRWNYKGETDFHFFLEHFLDLQPIANTFCVLFVAVVIVNLCVVVVYTFACLFVCLCIVVDLEVDLLKQPGPDCQRFLR